MVSRTASLPFNFLIPLLHTPRLPVSRSTSSKIPLQPISVHARHLHSTPITCATSHRNAGDSGKGNRQTVDPRVRLIRYHLEHPKTPRPLRLSRMRSLRHWTIHRAWMLFKRKKRESEERELLRMYQSMHNACEELRNLDGDNGKLFRIAMEKKGIFGPHGVPIEYARTQTETPAREPWDHNWKR